jgi:hypothetical protein
MRELAYHDRVNREYWAGRQLEIDARSEELKAIENTLARHGRGKDMSAMMAREAEIRADNAAAMGRHEEAAQIRREEELRILRELGAEDQKRVSAKREEAKWSAEIINSMRMRKPLIEREGSDSRDFAAEMREAKAGEVRKSFTEFRKQQQIDAMQAEIRGQESMLEIKLQGIERERAAGVDPWTLAQREADARLYALQAQQNYIDQTMVGQERLIANEEIAAQRRQILHEKELQHIAHVQRKRAEQRKQFEMIGNAVGRVHEGIAAAALRGAFAQGQSVKESRSAASSRPRLTTFRRRRSTSRMPASLARKRSLSEASPVRSEDSVEAEARTSRVWVATRSASARQAVGEAAARRRIDRWAKALRSRGSALPLPRARWI